MNGMPKPGENHARLQRLAGKWVGEEKTYPSPWGPGGTAVGRMEARIDVDGFFLIQDQTTEKAGKVSFRGHGVMGWDAAKNDYAWFWVDSMGQIPAAPSRGQWDGDRLVFESHHGGQHGRYTYEVVGPEGLRFKLEGSQDGKTWKTFMEATYRRES